jgi:hypothetical protein
MIGKPRRGSTARSASLIALATLAAHQLRYLIAYGSGAHAQLLHQGHAYLLGSLPILASFAIATIIGGLLRGTLGGSPARAAVASPALRALAYAAAVLAVFAIQESAEGILSAGHSAGLAAIFGAGGWVAIPLALVLGVLCSLLDGGFARLESRLAKQPARLLQRPLAVRAPGPRLVVPLASLPLAFGLARRPPPSAA